MPQTVLTGSTLAAGIRSDFENTYRQQWDGIEKNLSRVMMLDVPQTHLTETFGYREALPAPKLWMRGHPIPMGGLGSKSWSVTAYDYARKISWHRNDRADNKVGDLYTDAKTLAGRFARLDSVAFAEMLIGTASLLPGLPTAPDGQDLFYGSTRFGHANGNIYTGTGVAAVGTIQADFFGVLGRFDAFQDTAGEPLYEPDLNGGKYVIFVGSANRKLFNEAFVAENVHSVVSTTGAAVQNVVLASGEKVTLNFTPRITDNDWFVFREDAIVKPIFSTLREALRSAEEHEENSDVARATGLESVQFVIRKGYGLNLPYSVIKVNN